MLFINKILILSFFITTVNCLNLSNLFKFQQNKKVTKREAAATDKMIIVLHENGEIFGFENKKVFHFVLQQPLNIKLMNSNESLIETNLTMSNLIPEIYEDDEINPKSDITHVANGGKYTVYAMVERNKEFLKNVTKRFFDIAAKSNWQMPELPTSIPFMQIRSGAFEGFNPRANSNEKVFVTVFSHDIITGKIEKIADAYEVVSGSGVVIGYDNKIHDVKDGKLWIDPTGQSHSRRPQNV